MSHALIFLSESASSERRNCVLWRVTVFILPFPSIVKVVSPYKSARKLTVKQRKIMSVRTSNLEVVVLFCLFCCFVLLGK